MSTPLISPATLGDLVKRDAAFLQRVEALARAIDILLDGIGFGRAVIAEGIHRFGRHGVHRHGADQRVHIKGVGIGLVLGSGGGPEQALRTRAALGEIDDRGKPAWSRVKMA